MARLPDWLTWTIVGLVAMMAGVNFAAPFFVDTYQPNEVINGLFAAIVTSLIIGRRGNGNGNGNGKKDANKQDVPGGPVE